MTIKKPNNRHHRHSGDSERSMEEFRISPAGLKRGDSGQARMIIVASILVMAFFLRVYRLDDLIPFIGDFGWFYLSARDMILTGEIPLVGITSSHTWVHQGPLWTYLLAIPLFISNFNPVSGAYFTAIIGTVTVFYMYKIGAQMFSKFVGFAAAVLYATSPLVIVHSRIPYHTSLIPFASTLFIFFLYKWIKGDIRFLPLTVFSLGVLYNLELATVVFWILLMLVFAYGIIKRERWFTEALNPKVILLSVFLFLLTMLPMIIYDFKERSGFYQTTAFFRLIKIYLLSPSHVFSFEGIRDIFSSLFSYNQRLVFLGNGALASMLTIVSIFYLIVRHSGERSDSRISPAGLKRGDSGQARMTNNTLLLLFWIVIPLYAIIITQAPSEAYVPMLFPAIILAISLLFNYIYKRYAFLAIGVIIIVAITNTYLLLANNYLMEVAEGYGLAFSKRLSIAKEIVKKSKGREYNIIGKGKGNERKSFTMNYEYLLWWLGHPPSKNPQTLVFTVDDSIGRVTLTKTDKKL